MSRYKTFCLGCLKANDKCKCTNKRKTFTYSHKLRVPSINNKVRFRKFLDDCPEFVNCVSDDLKEEFRSLLRTMKYFNKTINGQQWTYTSK